MSRKPMKKTAKISVSVAKSMTIQRRFKFSIDDRKERMQQNLMWDKTFKNGLSEICGR